MVAKSVLLPRRDSGISSSTITTSVAPVEKPSAQGMMPRVRDTAAAATDQARYPASNAGRTGLNDASQPVIGARAKSGLALQGSDV